MTISKEQIIKEITNKQYLIDKSGIIEIYNYKDSCFLLQKIFESLENKNDVIVITKDYILKILDQVQNKNISTREENIKIITEFIEESTSKSSYDNFVAYFNNRYKKLNSIIKNKIISLKYIKDICWTNKELKHEISVIGIITEKSYTNNQNIILTVEDPTGNILVFIDKNDIELFEIGSNLVLDEVIGITGFMFHEKNKLLAKKIIQPDVPNYLTTKYTDGQILFISDIHIGSKEFMRSEWENFIDFLNGKNETLKTISSLVKYIVVAGDIVDGIGIYPNQELDLEIQDLDKQYETAGSYFKKIPSHIKIIIAPGNHDGVRKAEPQLSIKKKYSKYFPENVIFVGNPALVQIDEVLIQIYHGCSIDDLVADIKTVTYQNPTSGMKELIKRRHLCPIYGKRVMIAPEKIDYMVIEKIPQIFHCGHIHTVGIENYKNIILVNSGTWQAQTDFQKKVNITPDPAKVPTINLKNGKTCIIDFNIT